MAAREGSLRDLQSALDRRKFAVAKDEISPSGATPLHVAAVFGHAGEFRMCPINYVLTFMDRIRGGHAYNVTNTVQQKTFVGI